MTSITSTPADLTSTVPTIEDFAAAGVVLSSEEYAAIISWKPFCSPEGCVCEKYADCPYCEACSGSEAEQREDQAAYWAEYEEAQRGFGAYMYGEPTEDDYHDEW